MNIVPYNLFIHLSHTVILVILIIHRVKALCKRASPFHTILLLISPKCIFPKVYKHIQFCLLLSLQMKSQFCLLDSDFY